MRVLTIALSLLAFQASTADAQRVSLDIRNGGVTLDARDATVDDILAEWTRVGSMRVVRMRGESLGGARVTLLLRDITEQQALDLLLRGVSGYVLFARRDASTGLSAFEHVVIVQTSSPAAPGGTAQSPQVPRALDTPLFAAPSFVRAAQPTDLVEADPDALNQFAAEQPIPDGVDRTSPAATGGSGLNGTSGSAASSDPTAQPPTPLLPPSLGPDASNPFGRAPGSSRPGVVTPAGPPPGVMYPPITNPNVGNGFKPAGTP